MAKSNSVKLQAVLQSCLAFWSEDLQPEDVLTISKSLHAKKALTDGELQEIDRDKIDKGKMLLTLGKKPLWCYVTFMRILKSRHLDLYNKIRLEERKHRFNPYKGIAEGFTLIKSGDVTMGKLLGEGGFGKVFLAKHRQWGEVAVKQIKDEKFTKQIFKEARKMWQVIQCQNLVQIMGVIDDPNQLSIVMEYCEFGSLREFNREYMMKCSCWPRKVKMIRDVALGMNYLHTRDPPIIHRDLKLQNVFVGEGFRAKVGDFGLSVSTGTSSLLQSQSADKLAGTVSHLPPEAFSRRKLRSANSVDYRYDGFTFGITLFEFLSGKDPWPADYGPGDIMAEVVAGERPDLNDVPSETPEDVKNVMILCWDGKPNKRPKFQEIQQNISDLYDNKYKKDILSADAEILNQIKSSGKKPDEELAENLEEMSISDTEDDSGMISVESNASGFSDGKSITSVRMQDNQDSGAMIDMQITPANMDVQVTDKDINDIAQNAELLHENLQFLYSALGLTEAQIQNAERKADTRSYQLQAKGVLQFWKQKNGKRATRRTILQALKECNLTNSKEILEEKWSPSTDIGVWEKAEVIRENQKWLGGLALNPTNQDIAVADYSKHAQVAVYSHIGGRYKANFVLDDSQRLVKPSCVVYNQKKYYVTDTSPYVHSYSASDGKFRTKWLSVKPGETTGNRNAHVEGICVDEEGNLLVGHTPTNEGGDYVSKHKGDGTHIHSFSINMKPWFLALTSNDEVVVADGITSRVTIFDQHGTQLRSLKNDNLLSPQGVFCHKNLVLVCGYSSPDVHCFDQSGLYLSTIQIDAAGHFDMYKGCWCVVLNEDGTKMYVSRGHTEHESGRVEVYTRKK